MGESTVTTVKSWHLPRISEIHGSSFPHGWSVATLKELIANGAYGACILQSDVVRGFLLWRTVLDEAEILSMAVESSARKCGQGRFLLLSALKWMANSGVTRVFLEVADDNEAGKGLYRSVGFEQIGCRRGYYQRDQHTVDAQLLQLKLNTEGH